MVIANFKNDSHPIVYGASQWNYGEVLRIQGLNLPKAVEIHFSLEKNCRTGDTTNRHNERWSDGCQQEA